MDEIYRISPYVLRRDVGTDREEVVVAEVDGVQALIVCVSEEIADSLLCVTYVDGMEATPVTLREIELLCESRELCLVGLFGLDNGEGLDLFALETLAMVLEDAV